VTLRAKLIGAAVLLAALVGGYAAWKYHVEQLGAERYKTQAAETALDAMRRTLAQVQNDAQANEAAANALQAEKDRLTAALADAPVLRLCEPTGGGGLPAKAPAPRKPRQAPATGGSSAGVPTGATAGVDIGPGVQLLALVADRLAAQERALLQREAAIR